MSQWESTHQHHYQLLIALTKTQLLMELLSTKIPHGRWASLSFIIIPNTGLNLPSLFQKDLILNQSTIWHHQDKSATQCLSLHFSEVREYALVRHLLLRSWNALLPSWSVNLTLNLLIRQCMRENQLILFLKQRLQSTWKLRLSDLIWFKNQDCSLRFIKNLQKNLRQKF